MRGRLQQLPFGPGVFQAVFCISVIEHLPASDMIPALREMARVLEQGGRLLLTTDYAEDAGEPLRYQGPGEQFAVDWNIFDHRRILDLLERFTDLEVEGSLDLQVDWPRTRARMLAYHGYPYTALGIAFRKPEGENTKWPQ